MMGLKVPDIPIEKLEAPLKALKDFREKAKHVVDRMDNIDHLNSKQILQAGNVPVDLKSKKIIDRNESR